MTETVSPHRGSPRGRALRLSLGGGLAFWFANLAISLTPVAADYRAALSISYVPMLLEALLGGLLIAFCVGFCLLHAHDRIPGRGPVLKSGLLSLLALVLVTLLLEVPAKFLTATPHAVRYFLIGVAINTVRLLALALVVGGLFDRVTGDGQGVRNR